MSLRLVSRSLIRRAYSTPSYVDIATKQKLYMIDKTTPGSVFFMPHGTRLFERLIEFMKLQQRAFGFEQVVTPLIYKKELWETSGHYEHYKDDMFTIGSGSQENEEPDFSLKPMNCPGHCVMFGRHDHSFRELPVRYADFSPLHRNEASGALTGLTRVRKFHQDDGHIFCEHDQIQSEIESCLKLIETTYAKFGLNDYKMVLSTRPDQYSGEISQWNQAELGLKEALDKAAGKAWEINEGDGAFYGPKIDVLINDKNGKQHQLATIQLDFQLPHRFELQYQGKENMKTPVLIHRAIFGSLERFMALLIENYEGKWPFWLNPRQAVVLPIAQRHQEYAESIARQLSGKTFSDTALGNRSFNVELSATDETVGARIRRANELAAGYILVVGDKEMENQKIAVRERGSKKTAELSLEEVQQLFTSLEREYK